MRPGREAGMKARMETGRKLGKKARMRLGQGLGNDYVFVLLAEILSSQITTVSYTYTQQGTSLNPMKTYMRYINYNEGWDESWDGLNENEERKGENRKQGEVKVKW
jgi:hypothetical protein